VLSDAGSQRPETLAKQGTGPAVKAEPGKRTRQRGRRHADRCAHIALAEALDGDPKVIALGLV
jgi:hypothetical protein